MNNSGLSERPSLNQERPFFPYRPELCMPGTSCGQAKQIKWSNIIMSCHQDWVYDTTLFAPIALVNCCFSVQDYSRRRVQVSVQTPSQGCVIARRIERKWNSTRWKGQMMAHQSMARRAKCLLQIQPTWSEPSSWFLANHSSPFSPMTSNI